MKEILKLYDYIYYRIVSFYKKNYTAGGLYEGVIFLSLVQALNAEFLINTILVLLGIRIKEELFMLLICIYVFFILLNYVRYKKFRPYNVLSLIFDNEKGQKHKIKGVYVILYFIGTVILSAISAYLAHEGLWGI